MIKSHKDKITGFKQFVDQYTKMHTVSEMNKLHEVYRSIKSLSQRSVLNEKQRLVELNESVRKQSKTTLLQEKEKIDVKYRNVLSLSIEPTLQRGFTVTQDTDGKFITSSKEAAKSKELIISYHDGKVTTEVKRNG